MRFAWFVGLLLLVPPPAAAQDKPRCVFLCAPELKIEPTWTIENLGRRGRVEADGIFELEVPITIPRVGLTFEAIFVPFGRTSVHPFTGASAADLGRADIRDNGLEIESELNFHLFGTDQTAGWVS